MRPAVSILQLDTAFPRVAGDVACPDTYQDEIEVLRVEAATVGQIVHDHPDQIDITPFETALAQAQGDVIVTSCGFLSTWQSHLSKLTDRPFIASALNGLSQLQPHFNEAELLTVTFDATQLTDAHFGPHASYRQNLIGLPPDSHLRRVITQNAPRLDTVRAEAEVVQTVTKALTSDHRHILLECTNLPPYKAAITRATGLEITDILTLIEDHRPHTVDPLFL